MPSGGARARSGPPPDPNALRRDRDAGEWTILPADGRPGDPPVWPMEDQSGREADLWEALWRKPQAIVWERNGLEFEVALYVRRFTEAELMDSMVTLSTLVRQMGDSLGLTIPGMRANRWKIAVDSDGRPAPGAVVPTKSSSRSRLTVVPPDGE